jgi:uncharacterized protein YkwD
MPNQASRNSLNQAQAISLRSHIPYSGSVGRFDPQDYYQFRLDRRSRLDICLSETIANANLSLLDATGRTVRTAAGGGQDKSLDLSLNAGTYYIRVGYQGSRTNYQLTLAPAPTASTTASTRQVRGTLIQRVLMLTNIQRRQAGLQPLRLNAQLNAVAKGHSVDMATNDYFSHTGANGSSPFDRISAGGYTYATAAENIAAGFSTPAAAVNAWMNSPAHRANILDPDLQEIGIGYAYLANDLGVANYHYYWTQSFATPVS